MTVLSVNLNKIALLRNSRGRDFPNLCEYAGRFIKLGVKGITIHPRPDERHIKYQDAYDLADFLQGSDVELNIEGFPSDSFLTLVEATKPAQCTLVPDSADQLTSDHGWDFYKQGEFVTEIIKSLKGHGIRSSVFLEPDPTQIPLVSEAGADRIELYTEHYAEAFNSDVVDKVLAQYRETAISAQEAGIGVNAGHDLDLENLSKFLTIPDILEVSIGHALVVESINYGMDAVVKKYLAICNESI